MQIYGILLNIRGKTENFMEFYWISVEKQRISWNFVEFSSLKC